MSQFKKAIDLDNKIDYEGGTIEALFYYGIASSEMPKSVRPQAVALEAAWKIFRPFLDAFDAALEEAVDKEGDNP